MGLLEKQEAAPPSIFWTDMSHGYGKVRGSTCKVLEPQLLPAMNKARGKVHVVYHVKIWCHREAILRAIMAAIIPAECQALFPEPRVSVPAVACGILVLMSPSAEAEAQGN